MSSLPTPLNSLAGTRLERSSSNFNSVASLNQNKDTETDTESVYHGRQPDKSFSSPYLMDATLTQVCGEASSPGLNSDEPVLDGALGLIIMELKMMRQTVRNAILMRAPSLVESDGKSEGLVNLNGFTGFTELDEKEYGKVKYWYPHQYKEPKKKKEKKAKRKGKEKEKDNDDEEEEAPAKKGRARRAADENIANQFIEDAQGNTVPGQHVTTINRDVRSFYRLYFKKGLITCGGWDQISPLVRIAFYTLMHILAPELQLCFGNWKADRIGKKTFPGWWQNHRNNNEDDDEEELKDVDEVKEGDSQKTETVVLTGGGDGVGPIDIDAINVHNASTSASASASDASTSASTSALDPSLAVSNDSNANDLTDVMMEVTTDVINTSIEDAPNAPIGDSTLVSDTAASNAPVDVAIMVGKENSGPSGTKRPQSDSQTLSTDNPQGDREVSPPSKRARSEDQAEQAGLPKLNVVLFNKSKELPPPEQMSAVSDRS
ncbi:hypothetical protein PM082_009106 [Marasmius tenuissimus]|nr:hypothetical protein PM082_009106 [Marasmius tenuissimus]